MAGGRPKKTLKDLPKNWKEITIEMLSEGADLAEVKAELGLWDDTYYRMLEEIDEFKCTIKKGVMLSKKWWLEKGRKNLENPKFNYTGWYMQMKNKFKWSDKQQVSIEGEVKHTYGVIEAPAPIVEIKEGDDLSRYLTEGATEGMDDTGK